MCIDKGYRFRYIFRGGKNPGTNSALLDVGDFELSQIPIRTSSPKRYEELQHSPWKIMSILLLGVLVLTFERICQPS
jgi:hypothetical protein